MLNSVTERKTFEWKSLSTLNVLPYQDLNDVNLKKQSNMGDAMLLNNSLRRMVDNDLYNEQLILNIREGRNVPGATVTNLSTAVINGPENQKYALTSIADISEKHPYQIAIGKKKIADNDDQVSSVPFFEGRHVNFYMYDGRKWVVGTKDGIFCSGDRLSGWHRVGELGDDYLLNGFEGVDCRCCIRNVYQGLFRNDLDKYEFFLGTSERVIGFNTALEFGDVASWVNVHTDLVGITVNKLYLDKKEKCLFVCTNKGIYKCTGRQCSRIKKSQMYAIPDMLALDDNDLTVANERLLIATENGIKQSTNAYFPTNVIGLKNNLLIQSKNPEDQSLGTGINVTSLGIDMAGETVEFLGTENGLRKLNSENLSAEPTVYGNSDDVRKKYIFSTEYAGSTLYVGIRNNRTDKTNSYVKYETSPNSGNFQKVLGINVANQQSTTWEVKTIKDIYHAPFNCLIATSYSYPYIYLIDVEQGPEFMYPINEYEQSFGEPNSITVHGHDIYVASTNGIHILKITRNFYVQIDRHSWLFNKSVLYARKSNVDASDDTGWISIQDPGNTSSRKTFVTDRKLSSHQQINELNGEVLQFVEPLSRTSFYYATDSKGLNWTNTKDLKNPVSILKNDTLFKSLEKIDNEYSMCLVDRQNSINVKLIYKEADNTLVHGDILNLGVNGYSNAGSPQITFKNENGTNLLTIFAKKPGANSSLSTFSFEPYIGYKYSLDPYVHINRDWIGNENCKFVHIGLGEDDGIYGVASYGTSANIWGGNTISTASGTPVILNESQLRHVQTYRTFALSALSGSGSVNLLAYKDDGTLSSPTQLSAIVDNIVGMERIHLENWSDAIVLANNNKLQIWRPILASTDLSSINKKFDGISSKTIYSQNDNHVFTDAGAYHFNMWPSIYNCSEECHYPSNVVYETNLEIPNSPLFHMAGLSGTGFAWFYTSDMRIDSEGQSILDMSDNNELKNVLLSNYVCSAIALPRLDLEYPAWGMFARENDPQKTLQEYDGKYNNHRFVPFFMVGKQISSNKTINKIFYADNDVLDWHNINDLNNDTPSTSIKNSITNNTAGNAIALAGAGNFVVVAAKINNVAVLKYIRLDKDLVDGASEHQALKHDEIGDFSKWKVLSSDEYPSNSTSISHLSLKEGGGMVFGTVIISGDTTECYAIKQSGKNLILEKIAFPEGNPAVASFCQVRKDSDLIQFFTYSFDRHGNAKILGWQLNSNSTNSPLSEIEKTDVFMSKSGTNTVLALYDSFGGSSSNSKIPHAIFLIMSKNESNKNIIKNTKIMFRGYEFRQNESIDGFNFEHPLIEKTYPGKTIRKITTSHASSNTIDKTRQFVGLLLNDQNNKIDVSVLRTKSSSTNPEIEYETQEIDISAPIGKISNMDPKDISFGYIEVNIGGTFSKGINILGKDSVTNDDVIAHCGMIIDSTSESFDEKPIIIHGDSLKLENNKTINCLGRTYLDHFLFLLTNDVELSQSAKILKISNEKIVCAITSLLWKNDFGENIGRIKTITDENSNKYVIGIDGKTKLMFSKINGNCPQYETRTVIPADDDAGANTSYDIWDTYDTTRNMIFLRTNEGYMRSMREYQVSEYSKQYKVSAHDLVKQVPMSFMIDLDDSFHEKNPIEDYHFFNNSGMFRWLPLVELKMNRDRGEDGHIAYLTNSMVNEIKKDYSDFTFDEGRYDCTYCAVWDEELEEVDEETGKNLSTTHYAFTFDMEVYAINFSFLSSDIEDLTTQLPRKCEGIDTLADGNYLVNIGGELKVIDIVANRFINLELEDLESISYYNTDSNLEPIENITSLSPLKMVSNKSFILVANSGLLAKVVNYHKEICFEDPRGEYKILEKKFFDMDIRSLFRLDDRNIMVGTYDKGTYMVRNLAICISYLDDYGDLLTGNSQCITSVLQDASKGYRTKYLFSSGDKIYNTTNTVNSESEITTLPPGCRINFLCAENDTQYAMCTDVGLFITELHYDIDDELHRFSIESVAELAKEDVEPLIASHINSFHKEEFWTKLYKKAPASLSRVPDGFTTPQGIDLNNAVSILSNDIVSKVEFNDENKFIKASVRNWATEQLKGEAVYSTGNYIDRLEIGDRVFDLSEIPYTCKLWESGMIELMVYVPTTLTFYINNPKGFSNSTYSGQSINRPNIENNFTTDNTVPGKYTSLRLILDNEHFKIKTISEMQINGNSLPLRIYKDDTYCQEGRENLFDSVIQPSLVVSMPHIVISQNDTQKNVGSLEDGSDVLTLEFAVYGSDAQSIRILAMRDMS